MMAIVSPGTSKLLLATGDSPEKKFPTLCGAALSSAVRLRLHCHSSDAPLRLNSAA